MSEEAIESQETQEAAQAAAPEEAPEQGAETSETAETAQAPAPEAEGGQGAEEAPEAPAEPQPEVEAARFDNLDEESALQAEPSLEVILNIPVTLSMELGRTRMTIRELMELRRGSVVKFDRLAGEPMDVLVNGTLVAHGEVVVINDKFGIRLIDVISPADRVRSLR